jgi:hypothetical protein
MPDTWVCTADSAGSFQRRLTVTPNPRTRIVTLPEVITGDLARKFGEISLYNQHADFEFGSASNSNSTSLWDIACEPATKPSCADIPLHEHFHMASAMLVGPMRKLSLHAGPARRSSPTTLRTPTTTRTPPTSSTSDQTQTSPSPRTPRLSNHCQDQLPTWL